MSGMWSRWAARRRLNHAHVRLNAKLESLSLGCLMLHATGFHAEAENFVPKIERINHSLALIRARRHGLRRSS